MPGKTRRASSAIGVDQLVLRVVRAVPLAVRLEPDVELGVEEACGIGAGVVAAVLGRDDRDFGEALEDRANLRHDLRRFLERDRVRHRRAHPQRAFVELRHELAAARVRDAQRHREEHERRDHRRTCDAPGTNRARARTGRGSTRRRDSRAPSRRRAAPTRRAPESRVSVSSSDPISA